MGARNPRIFSVGGAEKWGTQISITPTTVLRRFVLCLGTTTMYL